MSSRMEITDISETGCFSVLTVTDQGNHREALSPGQFDRARKILPDDLYDQVCKIWTDEVVQVFKDSLSRKTVETIEEVMQIKLHEINTACESIITTGIDITTSQGTKHFSLTSEDQMNITALQMQFEKALTGQPSSINLAKGIPYHADGELCRYWSPDDFAVISEATVGHIFYHQTYCNHLRTYIRRITDMDELRSVQYGMKLPDDLTVSLLDLLNVS